jgi:hypothetical protein
LAVPSGVVEARRATAAPAREGILLAVVARRTNDHSDTFLSRSGLGLGTSSADRAGPGREGPSAGRGLPVLGHSANANATVTADATPTAAAVPVRLRADEASLIR